MRINSSQWMELQREHHKLLKLYFSLKHELEETEQKIDTLQNSQTRITISDPSEHIWTVRGRNRRWIDNLGLLDVSESKRRRA